MDKKKPIESVINIYDPSILWADLSPQYNGYQISNTGLVRSMKFFKKYPFGILLEPENGKIKISNSLNQVEQVDVLEIYNSMHKSAFNIPSNSTYTRSRNPLMTSQSKIIIDKQKWKDELKKPSGFHFKILGEK